MTQQIRLTILGQPASKHNSRRQMMLGDRLTLVKSNKAYAFEQAALPQIPIACRVQLECDVRVTLHIFYESRRSDLDETVVLDVLQTRWKGKGADRHVVQRGIYENDRQVKEKHVFWHLDKENPRCEILIEPLEAIQPGLGLPEPPAPDLAALARERFSLGGTRRPKAARTPTPVNLTGTAVRVGNLKVKNPRSDGQPF